MANNQNNTERKGPVTATFGPSYYGKSETGENRRLDTKYLNDVMMLAVRRPLSSTQQTSRAKFDNKSGTEIWFDFRTARKMAKYMKKAIEEGESLTKSRGTNVKNHMIEVAPGAKYGCAEGSIVLAILFNMNENKVPEYIDVFELSSDITITDFAATGDSANYEVEREFFDPTALMEQFKDFAREENKASAHVTHQVDQWRNDKNYEYVMNIMKALNCAPERNGGARSSTSSWETNNSGNATPTTNVANSSSELIDAVASL